MRRHLRENLLPIIVMVMFAVATLFSARQLMNHTAQLHERYFNNRAAAQDLGRAFNDFEASFLSYLSNDNRHTEDNLRSGIHYLKKMYSLFYRTIKVNEVDSQFMVHADGLKTDLDVMEKFFKPGAFESKQSMNEAAIAALYQIHTSLSDLGYDLILDHSNAFNGEEMSQHRYTLYGSVFMMALSGIVLIVLLVFKIDRLEEAGEDKEVTVKTLEDRLAAIELAGDGIGIAESDGRLSFVNRAFVETYGYTSVSELVGQKWIGFCDDDIRPTLEREVFDSLGTGASWKGVGTGYRRDGSTFKKSISIAALPRGRWIFVVHDVTDSLKAEEMSRKSLAAIEAAGDGIGITDAEGNMTYMNRALKELHELDEYQAQDLIGKPWENLYSDSGRDHIISHVLPDLKRLGYWKGEAPIKTRTGRLVHAEMTLTGLPDGGMIGTARDISDRIEAEHERVELEKQFYQAQKMEAVGRLAGGIAHDFNNILAAMMGYSEFLIEDLPEDSKEQKYAQSIYEGGTQARDVIDRLLMYSKTQDHKMELMDLGRKIEGVVTMLRSSIPTTIDIQMENEVDGLQILGNKTLITQAVMNLCVNARDAIVEEHGFINLRIDRETYNGLPDHYYVLGELEPGREYYALHIRDSGSGMSEEVMERIFEPFFTTKPVDQGTGLGLSSVHGIMVTHEGAVAVASTVGKGTEFILFFPVAVAGVEVADHAMPRANTDMLPAPDMKIMIVDDQKDVREMMAVMMDRMGFATELHERAATALESLARDPDSFGVVITDQTMPGMTGAEMAKIIERTHREMPVILMSGFSTENLAELTDDIVAIVSVLHKPLVLADVERAVSQALMGRSQAA
jgi:PAS domain S-box-containing protein